MRSGKALAPRAGVPLASLGTLGVGGAARWFVRADTPTMSLPRGPWCEEQSIPWFVLGGGSNVVIADRLRRAGAADRHDRDDGIARRGRLR